MSSASWSDALDRMLVRIDDTANRVTEGFPHYADPQTGEWTLSEAGDWTGGFWNGMLWLAHVATNEQKYLDWAERWTDLLRPRAQTETIFRGFLFYYGAALGDQLLGNSLGKEVALSGAQGLATLYNPNARVIPLGEEAEEASDVGRGDANIDGVQGTSLLIWASRHLNDQSLYDIGIEHALRINDFCVREDDSVCQSARFDPQSGEMLKRYTHKGYNDDTTWARAQAWAMLGYAVNAIWAPERPEFLDIATRTADWWLEHIPEDKVAFWDFDAPPEDRKRDTSGTAIATAALLKLSALAANEEDRQRYREAAEDTARALVEGYLTPTGPDDDRSPGILTQGCYNYRIGLATENELIWGDYYLFEALQVLAGNLDSAVI